MKAADVLLFVVLFAIVCGADYLVDMTLLDGPVVIDFGWAAIMAGLATVLNAIRETANGR